MYFIFVLFAVVYWDITVHSSPVPLANDSAVLPRLYTGNELWLYFSELGWDISDTICVKILFHALHYAAAVAHDSRSVRPWLEMKL